MTTFRSIEISDPTTSHEGLRFVTVKSDALRRRADITFYVPDAADAAGPVPLVILLHGVQGSHWAWALQGDAAGTTSRLIADASIPPIVLAMPSDGLWGDGSGYVCHADADYERWIIDEVPAVAAALDIGVTQASPLCLGGLSMGGFGALRLAGKYAGRVAAAAGHSSITHASQLDDLIAESRADWSAAPEDASILNALLAASDPLPPLRFDCGAQDGLLPANRELHHALDRAGIDHVYVENHGGHDWGYWRRELAHSLIFFADKLAGRA